MQIRVCNERSDFVVAGIQTVATSLVSIPVIERRGYPIVEHRVCHGRCDITLKLVRALNCFEIFVNN